MKRIQKSLFSNNGHNPSHNQSDNTQHILEFLQLLGQGFNMDKLSDLTVTLSPSSESGARNRKTNCHGDGTVLNGTWI